MIKAVQFTGFNFEEIENFVGGDYGKDEKGNQVIATSDGALKIANGDWIIKKAGGKFYTGKINVNTSNR